MGKPEANGKNKNDKAKMMVKGAGIKWGAERACILVTRVQEKLIR